MFVNESPRKIDEIGFVKNLRNDAKEKNNVFSHPMSFSLPGEHPAAMQHGGTGDVNRRLVLLVLIVLVDTMFR